MGLKRSGISLRMSFPTMLFDGSDQRMKQRTQADSSCSSSEPTSGEIFCG